MEYPSFLQLFEAYLSAIAMLLPALLIGLFKYRNLAGNHKPFIWILLLLFFTETLQFILRLSHVFNVLSYNIYIILFAILFIYQFFRWKMIGKNLATALVVACVVVWSLDHFVINYPRIGESTNLFGSTRFFRLFYALILTLLSMFSIFKLTTGTETHLFRNHIFYISLALIIFYTFYVYRWVYLDFSFFSAREREVSEVFQRLLNKTGSFVINLYYLLFIMATIWMPRKKIFFINF